MYMSAYSWANITEGYLSWKVFGGEAHPPVLKGKANPQDV